ncbi:ABC transporter permease [Shimwellia blattae]|uniref:Putative ABC transporter permease protein YehY n=1 Tax=Shimwellia blattae (strain ATCC 29907 / DSM 4481 / JCM 1650 / NBRC 105725 / CDC 9005-74) TaxID=630626 RepID=I2B7H5_SHIBC|nr:ABC transporter permease [Shimwellia blattae]AFJ46479.1 putative ABC transporter permease protein YehY [Shimwellia blattae DSM 4481 = NBRC 105725]GAB80060.1 putative osmoprotectant ABC transporter permease protein YehY [Shimwellia blattae DSM 4481 = NBRC 105725]VDY63947.1 Putative osmoprotectant uptake system permease protein yehY [Shimwellia blattae]VEC22083.1 Putative osmoprotectant uptake system permease protein yehY [Shimwellia blattae]
MASNRVLWLLLVLMTGALIFLPLVNLAPNRLVSGTPLMVWSPGAVVLWLLAPLLGLWGLCLLAPGRNGLILLCCQLLFTCALWMLGQLADQLMQHSGSLARVTPGSGWWVVLAGSLLGAMDASQRLTPRPLYRLALNLQIWLLPVLMLAGGCFSATSLLREYHNRADVFQAALAGHLLYLPGVLVPGLLIALPAGWWCQRSARARRTLLPLLNIIQTVPSVALFGLLIAPLTRLAQRFPVLGEWGISGIGLAPALVALVLYSLLPLVRGVMSGLDAVPARVTESARGMGMSRGQLAWRVELPLALPVLLRSLRVVAVQTTGLAVVAALIGAGGLGTLIFQGLLSSAMDLVLLGVIPTVALAVVVDTVFRCLLALVEESPGDRI